MVTTTRSGAGAGAESDIATRGEVEARVVINCAGNYGDVVERMGGKVRGEGESNRKAGCSSGRCRSKLRSAYIK